MFLKLFEYFDRYLIDKSYKVTICNGSVHIINYLEIEDFSSVRVVVRYEEGEMVILGSDLVVSKMQADEVLIVGNLKSISYI